MYSLPNNNFNAIAIALMRDAVRINSQGDERPEGRNVFYLRQTSPFFSTYHANERTLLDGRVLNVVFTDTYDIGMNNSLSTLEIQLLPSEANTAGLSTRETSNAQLKDLGRYGGLYSMLAQLGKNPSLESVWEHKSPVRRIDYNLINGEITVRYGKRKPRSRRISQSEILGVMSRYQRFGAEVLAVLQGNAKIITVS